MTIIERQTKPGTSTLMPRIPNCPLLALRIVMHQSCQHVKRPYHQPASSRYDLVRLRNRSQIIFHQFWSHFGHVESKSDPAGGQLVQTLNPVIIDIISSFNHKDIKIINSTANLSVCTFCATDSSIFLHPHHSLNCTRNQRAKCLKECPRITLECGLQC